MNSWHIHHKTDLEYYVELSLLAELAADLIALTFSSFLFFATFRFDSNWLSSPPDLDVTASATRYLSSTAQEVVRRVADDPFVVVEGQHRKKLLSFFNQS